MSVYQYYHTYVVEDGQITDTNDETQLLSSFLQKRVYIIVSKYNVNTLIMLNIKDYISKESNINLNLSIAEFCDNLNDLLVLKYTSNDIPLKNITTGAFDNRLKIYDANSLKDVDISYTSISDPSNKNNKYSFFQSNDLVLTSDSNRDFTNCLITVNGVFHSTEYYNNNFFVKNGFSNIKNTKQKNVCLIDTTNLGGHSTIPITLEDIEIPSGSSIPSSITLNFKNANFLNKTIIPVIYGYPLLNKDFFKVLDNTRIKIYINRIDYIYQFLKSPNTLFSKYNSYLIDRHREFYIDTPEPDIIDSIVDLMTVEYTKFMTYNKPHTGIVDFGKREDTPEMVNSLDVFFSDFYPKMVSEDRDVNLIEFENSQYYNQLKNLFNIIKKSHLQSKDFILQLLTMFNSFIITINNPDIFIKNYKCYSLNNKGYMYTCKSKDTPRGLLVYNKSFVLPYNICTDGTHNHHILNIDFYDHTNLLYDKNPFTDYFPNPFYDQNNATNYPVEIVEFYSKAI